MHRPIIIGSRGSDLALWQAKYVQAKLADLGYDSTITIIETQGDRVQDLSFDKLEGKGFFTKEIEEQLLSSKIDIAVHSHKDLETTQPKGLVIAAIPKRESPVDVLLIAKKSYSPLMVHGVKENGIIGTSSARRKNQIRAFRPDVVLKDLRGNVPTRINKLRSGAYDAIMLAKAGLNRLEIDLKEFVVFDLEPTEFIPAPAQGALALQIRDEEAELKVILEKLTDEETWIITEIERKVLNLFDGGCQLPLGVFVNFDGEQYNLWASMAKDWNNMPRRIQVSGDFKTLAIKAVESLKSKLNITVYLSHNLPANHFLIRYCSANGMRLIAESQITARVKSVQFPKTTWVFFTSSNSVQAYFDNGGSLDRKFGAMGAQTAQTAKLHVTCEFIGDGMPEVVAESFQSTLGSDLVCFPMSNKSKRSIQKSLPSKQVFDVVAYETIEEPKQVENSDYYLFTSPSNVDSFFKINQLPKDARIIAIGPSTQRRLAELNIQSTSSHAASFMSMIDGILC
ncbi:hydroxymethylbilane synthase [Flavobacteriales bacterium]|nr:hydroxymethylbilane synthase [Flavobacteriales bacterium]